MLKARFIAALSAMALLGAGCAGPGPAAPPQDEAAAPATEIETTGLAEGTAVSIGPDGFNPSVLTVKKGTTVIFINEDAGAGHRVVSDPRPPQADYPGFDSVDPVAPGASFSFTFDWVGAWGYRDDQNPPLTGTIIVTE